MSETEQLIYGVNPVFEALKGRQRKALELLLLSTAESQRLTMLKDEAEKRRVPIRLVGRSELERMVSGGRHQGAVLRVGPWGSVPLDELLERCRASSEAGLFLVLDGVTDPHNLGALARSAEAAGCVGLILPKDRSCPVNATAEKAAAGAFAHLPVCRVTNVARTLDALKRGGFWVYGLAGEAGARCLFEADLRGPVVLVVGSEGKGLRDNVRKHCDALLAVPMLGHISSLNASVAGAVALFEIVRQRRG